MSNGQTLSLINDLITRVIELCQHDYGLFFQCSLVNWEFNRAASRMLYSRVVISHSRSPVLNLRETSGISESSNFTSSLQSRNAPYVLSLEIKGFISPRAPPRNTLSITLASSIHLFPNLRRVCFIPTTYHEDLFLPVLPSLVEFQQHSPNRLTDVTVNQSCFTVKDVSGETEPETNSASILVQLGGLQKLTLINPGRAILQLLPEWLGRLQQTLTELHLQNNCGSVTPGVLKSFIPHIKDRLQAITLGLSYSLTDDDVFSFLDSLPHLVRVHLRYYWQMKHPPRQPALRSLRYFIITHPHLGSALEVQDLGKWVRRAIAGSPELEVLRLQREGEKTAGDNDENDLSREGYCTPGTSEDEDDEDDDDRPPASHVLACSGLIDHVIKKHAEKIRVLDLGEAFVGIRQLREVMEKCGRLEHLRMTVDKSALKIFAEDKAACLGLRTVSLRIANCGPRFRVDKQLVFEVLHPGHPTLRRAEINGTIWQASWIVGANHEPPSDALFLLQRVKYRASPWDR